MYFVRSSSPAELKKIKQTFRVNLHQVPMPHNFIWNSILHFMIQRKIAAKWIEDVQLFINSFVMSIVHMSCHWTFQWGVTRINLFKDSGLKLLMFLSSAIRRGISRVCVECVLRQSSIPLLKKREIWKLVARDLFELFS